MTTTRQNMPQYIRDAYQQIKTIHRLVLTVSDDMGDLAMADADGPYERMQDVLADIECKLAAMRESLYTISSRSL